MIKKSTDEFVKIKNREFIFSCIIAAYNLENYISETLDSIINQTLSFKKYIQIIIVNDGSVDKTEEICLKYEKMYPENIIYIYKKNGGVSSARNVGLKFAQGRFVNFIDGDDLFTKNALNRVNYFFCHGHKNISVATIDMLNFGKDFEDQESYYSRFYKNDGVVDFLTTFDFAVFNPGMIFIKNEYATKFRFNENIKIGEDVQYYYKVFIETLSCGVISGANYMHRIRAGSATTSPRKYEDTYKLVSVVLKDLCDYSISIYNYVQQFICELSCNIIVHEVLKRFDDYDDKQREELFIAIKALLNKFSEDQMRKAVFVDRDNIIKLIKMRNTKSNDFFNPLVSIIIPVYNGSNYMREAIDSALNQTYRNIEVIVVNDGSNDDTDVIAKSYGDKIRYYKKSNGGVSTALNLGISKMKGTYFSWLSHDDKYLPKKIETQIDYLSECEDKDIILFSDYHLIDKNGNGIEDCKKPHEEIEEKPEYALYRGHINGNSLLIPKEAFEKCGTFNEKLKCSQDYLLWYEMMKEYKFVHIPEFLICSRVHNKQVTETNPLVDKEGNWFWTKIIDELPLRRRIELEGSNYNFLVRMAKFLETTPYKKTQHYCEDEANKEYEKVRKNYTNNKVSIIIPFYNRIELVKRSLASALNQTYKNIEVLLVNDGSTEDVSSIKKMIEGKENVRLINVEPNKGAANARNVGIKEATGNYIAFLDSDDEFLPRKVETQLFRMVLENADISYTKYIRMDNKGKETILPVEIINGNPLPKFIYSCGVATPTVMIRRNYLIDNNYFYNPDLVIGEDTCFWLTMLKHNTILGLEDALTIVHVVSTSAANSIQKQVIGYRTILGYLLNDEFYKQFDYEIGLLAKVYADVAKKNRNYHVREDGTLVKKDPPKVITYYRDVKFTLKTYGVKATGKRIYNKLTRKKK